MRFSINIECGNDAFGDDPHPEIVRILRSIADDLDDGPFDGPVGLQDVRVSDVNGNNVGTVYLGERSMDMASALSDLLAWATGPDKTGNPYQFPAVVRALLTLGEVSGATVPVRDLRTHVVNYDANEMFRKGPLYKHLNVMPASIRVGDRVKVYTDPVTRQDLEGIAVVTDLGNSCSGPLRRLMVEFPEMTDSEGTEFPVEREVHFRDVILDDTPEVQS